MKSDSFDRSLIENNLASRPPSLVAHYTSINTLIHFLKPVHSGVDGRGGWTSAFASPIQFLNDRQELRLGLSTLSRSTSAVKVSSAVAGILQELILSNGDLRSDPFQMSFSGSPDELGQWRGYGKNGYGCSIQTDIASLNRLSAVSGWVIYDPNAQENFARTILESIADLEDPLLIQQYLSAAASFIKHPGFAQENEYRVIVFPDPEQVKYRPIGDRISQYVDLLENTSLSVNQILIGPAWQLSGLTATEFENHHVVQPIRRLLNAAKQESALLMPSSIPYDPE